MTDQDKIKVLLVEDDEEDYILLRDFLSDSIRTKFTLDWVHSFKEGLAAITSGKHDVYLFDYYLGAENGLDLIKKANEQGCNEPLILLTGVGDEDIDKQALSFGASDYLVKQNITTDSLERSIRYAIERKKNEKERADLITARIEKTQAQLAEQKITRVLESITDSFTSLDKNWNCIFINTKAAQMLGRNIEDVIGENIWDILPEEEKQQIYDKCVEAMKTQQNIQLEYQSPSIGRWLRAHLYPSPEGISAHISDITDQKEVEKRKDEFIGLASHELKTPVTTIQAFVQLLGKYFDQLHDDKALNYLQKAEKQLHKLTILIEELLGVSRIQSGKFQLNKDKISVDEFVHEVVEDVQPISRKHSISVHGKTHAYIEVDKYRISQVLTNLLTNATKYSPNADKVEVGLIKKSGKVLISVKDYGVGISSKHLNKVFQRFYRIEEEKYKTYPGLGLGLYISAEIVKRHEGDIWVESEEEKGSTFYFNLPVSS